MTCFTRLACVVAFGFSATVFAAQTPTQPAGVESMEATITAVQGLVQVRQGPDKDWAKAEVGMKVSEQGEFRTGPKSAVQFRIPPEQTITLDRLGTVKLLEAANNNGKLSTHLGMKYGRTHFDIETAGREHDASISTPSSTLAVRGTQFIAYDQRPFRAQGVSLDGTVNFRDGKKQVNIGGRNAGKTKVDIESTSAAELALAETTSDPSLAFARSGAEGPLVDRLLASGSTVFFDRAAQIKVVTGGTVPNDQQLLGVLPGALNFVARWNTNTDLNLSVSTPGGPGNAGETLYPIGALATNSSGGKVAFDHRGGANGGIEIIYFPSRAPDGLYGVGLTLVRGQSTPAQVDVFRQDGTRVGIFDGSQTVTTANVQVDPPIPGFVDGTFVGVVPVNTTIPGASATAQKASAKTKTTTAAPVKTPVKAVKADKAPKRR